MCSSGFFASSEKDTRLDKVPGVVVASESVVGASDTLCSSSQGVRPGMPSALAARLTARRADLLRSLRGRAQLKLSHAFHVVAIATSPAPKERKVCFCRLRLVQGRQVLPTEPT
jgi:hypothetical protein